MVLVLAGRLDASGWARVRYLPGRPPLQQQSAMQQANGKFLARRLGLELRLPFERVLFVFFF
jgi:hypothetical protein